MHFLRSETNTEKKPVSKSMDWFLYDIGHGRERVKTKEMDWIIINNKFNNSFHATGLFPYPLKTSEK